MSFRALGYLEFLIKCSQKQDRVSFSTEKIFRWNLEGIWNTSVQFFMSYRKTWLKTLQIYALWKVKSNQAPKQIFE